MIHRDQSAPDESRLAGKMPNHGICRSMVTLASFAKLIVALACCSTAHGHSAARIWNEECLDAIRRDFPAPTVHARNLFHCSAAMYDAWAAYSAQSVGVFHNESASAGDLVAARNEAVSYAGYRILRSRYASGVNAAATIAALDARMATFGYPISETTTIGTSPAAVGNRCAAAVLSASSNDGSNQQGGYSPNTGYAPINPPLILQYSGSGNLVDPSRWQPLAFDVAFTQNGLVADKIQTFIGSHWGHVKAFALSGPWEAGLYADIDPGPPLFLGGPTDLNFKETFVEVIRRSADLDPASSEMIDISPGAIGNSALGTNAGQGHPLNPVTGQPYPPNLVSRANFGRVLAEFWADGPQSETPPGHWNTIANIVSDVPSFEKRLFGTGPVLDDLEWDVKIYLTLNASLHDAAIAAWGIKAHYDFVRPITAIRYMGGLGQSSNSGGGSYHPHGLPLIAGLIELVTPETSGGGQRHAGLSVGEVAIRAWRGEPADPENQTGGVGWIHAEDWRPYQRSTFVTPAFAGYVSGHSTFSRAAAEVLTSLTGSPFFPGGMATHTAPEGSLDFEYGPSSLVQLQWATYYDAADQAGLSRIYGGIHPPADDTPGRMVGSKVGKSALSKALPYTDGSILENFHCDLVRQDGSRSISWDCLPGYLYKVQWSETLAPESFQDLTSLQTYPSKTASHLDTSAPGTRRFYRVVRIAP
jgi:hypothetical protein